MISKKSLNRRQFLKTVALGAGAALVPSTALAFITEKPFDPGFKSKKISLVWRGDNYHCHYTDKTFVVAHKAKGVLPVPDNCPDPTFSFLKKNSFDRLLDKNRVTIKTKTLLKMIDDYGYHETEYQAYTDLGEVLDLHPGDCVDSLTGVSLLSFIRYPCFSDHRYLTSNSHQEWVVVNVDTIRIMLKSAPSIISVAFNKTTMNFASLDGSWAAFFTVSVK